MSEKNLNIEGLFFSLKKAMVMVNAVW